MAQTVEKQAFNRKEAAAYLGMAENTFVKLMGSGRVHFVKVGRRILVPRTSLDSFLNGCITENVAVNA